MTVPAASTCTTASTTGHGYVIPAGTAKDWLGEEYRAIAVLLKTTKAISAYSHVHRIFTEAQRLAMWARDQERVESIFYTDAHHVTEWASGGRTSVDNGMLVGRWDHVHRFDRGWRTIITDGVPSWIPPPPLA